MRVTITCQECGERMRLERNITAPERLYLMCHQCETPLKVDIAEVKPQKTKFPSWLVRMR